MDIQDTTMTVLDYCSALDRNEIKVNPKYQRSPKVWPPAARSFLIETILLGYPIPKLSLHQRTDVRSRRSVKEVVDGQQRTRAIRDFYEGNFRLSSTLELAEAKGKKLAQLDEDLQQTFLEYGLNFDVFVATTEREVREVFRRMNSFTVPLNDEEQRHAVYQGPFKWFIHKLAGDYGDAMISVGVFTPRQVIRMADSKLYTEIVHACLNGIKTTSKKSLGDLYKSRDDEFPEQEELDRLMRSALDRFITWQDIVDTPLTKTYNVYALLLACIFVEKPVGPLMPTRPPTNSSFSTTRKSSRISRPWPIRSRPMTLTSTSHRLLMQPLSVRT
jgi:hypothetical protein